MKSFLVCAVTFTFFSFAFVVGAEAQGVWQQLQAPEKEDAEARSKAWAETVEKQCDDAAKDPSAAKCRSYYLSNKYLVHWLAQESPVQPGVITEVLVRSDQAVVCYRDQSVPSEDTVPCTPLRRVN